MVVNGGENFSDPRGGGWDRDTSRAGREESRKEQVAVSRQGSGSGKARQPPGLPLLSSPGWEWVGEGKGTRF